MALAEFSEGAENGSFCSLREEGLNPKGYWGTLMNADPPASPEGEADGGQVCTDRAIVFQLSLVLTSVDSICVYLRKSVAKFKTKCADKVTQVCRNC